MPDLVVHFIERDWLVLVEAVTSHGPVSAKRHEELGGCSKAPRLGLYSSQRSWIARRAGTVYQRDLMGDGSVGGRVADPPDPFQRRAVLGPYAALDDVNTGSAELVGESYERSETRLHRPPS